MSPSEPVFEPATEDDVDDLLKLQYLCYQGEAERYDEWRLPALVEPRDTLLSVLKRETVIACRLDGELIASVRAETDSLRFHIGRLIVHPRFRRAGIGRRLLRGIEAAAPPGAELEFYTGHRSVEYLALLESEGYRETRREPVSTRLTLVYLTKQTERKDGSP
ncbi:GNAT family N-acetyltransferase [Glycomyces luteolus]|uniref:GNAT family N-acetyltransferase n=1 Tax=Glycomyces luteolus TaxID=2670330 RepID=A0A9X3PAJ5_9ACTN|nr:GNAT family N-acetyltransferase [Glycomyces luteolus]MDA1361863.1 GNAT family N-acetyltransferase [Glycomyces luteolus]